MMMLELEYFFLCSEQGVTSHSHQRAGPTAPVQVGLDTQVGPQGGPRGGEGCCRQKGLAGVKCEGPSGQSENLPLPPGWPLGKDPQLPPPPGSR